MNSSSVKKLLEGDPPTKIDSIDELSDGFFNSFIMEGLQVDLMEPGRVVCSLTVPHRLLNTANFLHGGAIASLIDLVGSAALHTVGATSSGSSLEINISYLDSAFENHLLVSAGGGEVIESVGATLGVVKGEQVVEIGLMEKGIFVQHKLGLDEVEIEAKVLRMGKAIGVVVVELRKKKTGKIMAQGRHTKYLPIPSKL
ncbi:hypothetical protein Scep_002871 [Stephania cephalantha]|uniref:Thioesterase domain-containing protein n=1 Tax=Stephania cephalantha TaxID=152367 RepID=A0AAP0Q505_9MAGN